MVPNVAYAAGRLGYERGDNYFPFSISIPAQCIVTACSGPSSQAEDDVCVLSAAVWRHCRVAAMYDVRAPSDR